MGMYLLGTFPVVPFFYFRYDNLRVQSIKWLVVSWKISGWTINPRMFYNHDDDVRVVNESQSFPYSTRYIVQKTY